MQARFLHPKYWPTWFGLGVLRLFEPLPHALLYRLGRALGALVYLFPSPFKRTATRNIELCLPELDAAARTHILKEHFRGLGVALFETAISWWSSNERIRHLTQMEGLEHLETARRAGRGALLLSAHFNSIEIGCRALAARLPLNVMYRPTKNELIGEFVQSRRAVQTKRAIRRDDVRTLVKALKDGDVVWYAPDQSFRKKGAQMVTLFGIPAATNTATSRIAQMTGALVLPYFFERLPGGGYRGVIHPPLDDFPTDDSVADTERFNRIVESEVRRMPDQYLWIHRRFKGLSTDYPDYYGRTRPS
ncbi:MAG TPA: LpxL/LpxP family Kdo(2)-lipid IV(A) lauroyl/palmitoleoyl acyltransferase [Steroidobacteraceae bacterium]|nr:LpxL/LpxP family Kdo(2)-lipid IV(A) lauroyl/palmitoleoyl acyltransferase [Steroidobacteraceae bacterium]